MTSSFWTDGVDELAKGIKQHIETRIQEVRAKMLELTNPTELAVCKEHIRQLEVERDQQLDQIDNSIF